MSAKQTISSGQASLGIEFGSTRIKAVLVDRKCNPIALGTYEWENKLENGLWTYSEEDIKTGLRECYRSLREDVFERYGVEIETLASIGISAMMHGYLAFDKDGKLLVPFRTWRNTNTAEAASKLSALFDFNIPLRWSISHLYQAILNKEEHVSSIASINTLAGFVHTLLTSEKVLGVGDASGMLPVEGLSYRSDMIEKFSSLDEVKGRFDWRLEEILPRILPAGSPAGRLTEEGAALLDDSGKLRPGVPFCPPEGDAGTGMVATNAVRVRTGNVSAGTSSFSMIVLEKPLSRPYEMIDMVTTPDGAPVAMVHCNNCTSELNAWVGLFREFASLYTDKEADVNRIYSLLYNNSIEKGDADCGGLVSYNYLSGEPVTGFSQGRPLFVKSATDSFSLANFFRCQLYASVAVLKYGNDILFGAEGVKVDRITAHGGLFKTRGVGQRVLSAAMSSPISVMETASEGGAWGIAVLAAYMLDGQGLSLADYLDSKVFADAKVETLCASGEEIRGFEEYMRNYNACLAVERAAVENKA